MSGMKEGHINAAMNRLEEFLDGYLKISKESSQRLVDLSNTSDLDETIRDADNATINLQNPSQIALKFAGNEIETLNQQKSDMAKLMAEANELKSQAKDLESKAATIRRESEIAKNQIYSEIKSINERAQHKIDTTSWINLALDKEVHETNLLRKRVIKLTEDEKKAVEMLEQAADIRRKAIGKYKSVSRVGKSIREEMKTIEAVAQNKQKKQDDSVAFKNEIEERLKALSKIDYERFLPNGFAQLNNQINAFNNAFSSNDFQTCSTSGKSVCNALKEFQANVTQLKRAFEEAETNAKDHLKAAKDEFSSINVSDLKRWSGKAVEVENSFSELNAASEQIEEASKKANKPTAFLTPDAKIDNAVKSIRELIDLSCKNKHKFQERDAIRKAIVKALKQQKYDKPVAYYNSKMPDGTPNELSDLTIYAQNPASTGDMRLKIDLDGKVGLEVFRHDKDGNEEEVTNQDAHNCHNSVKNLGEALKDAGFDFEITNWGKAEGMDNLRQVAGKPNYCKEQEKQQERLRERVQERNRQRY